MYRRKNQFKTKKALKAFRKGKVKITTDATLCGCRIVEFIFKQKLYLYTTLPNGEINVYENL